MSLSATDCFVIGECCLIGKKCQTVEFCLPKLNFIFFDSNFWIYLSLNVVLSQGPRLEQHWSVKKGLPYKVNTIVIAFNFAKILMNTSDMDVTHHV